MIDLFGRRAKRENIYLRSCLVKLDNELIYIKRSISQLIARNAALEEENRQLSLLVQSLDLDVNYPNSERN